MRSSALLIACFLGLFPIFGSAQTSGYALQDILQRYTEAYGGFRDDNALTSLSVEGGIEQEGRSFDFLMRKKRPFALRYRLADGPDNVVSGYNGSEAWIRTESNGEISIKSLDSKQEAVLRRQARFDSPLFRHLEKSENKIELIDRMARDGRSVFVIEVVEPDKKVFRYYLDALTTHVLQCDQMGPEGEVVFQTLYRDYREVEGFPFAFEVETRIDGKTISLAKVDKIEVNPGILSFYFEKPKR